MPTEKPGTSTPRRLQDVSEQEKRDARITTAGLLNNIIAAGNPPDMWVRLLIYALNVHRHGTRKSLGLKVTHKPEWRDSDGTSNRES